MRRDSLSIEGMIEQQVLNNFEHKFEQYVIKNKYFSVHCWYKLMEMFETLQIVP